MSAAQWSVVDIDQSQISEVQSLFQRVFKHALSERLWRWKYDQGRGAAVGARAPSGELLAHYGGTFRTVLFMGHPTLAVQIGDVMVAQEGRAALAHKGPFGMVVQAFLQRYIGSGADPELGTAAALGFGFPNARHMRLGERLGHYAQVDTLFELTWRIGAQSVKHLARNGVFSRVFRAKSRTHAMDWADPATAVVLDKLWGEMKSDLRHLAVPCRDSAWWRYRYANHPEHQYQCYLVQAPWTGRVLGALVLRRHIANGSASGAHTVGGTESVWELMDWLAPATQTPAMLQAALHIVAANHGGSLMGWFSSNIRAAFSGAGATEHEVCSVGVTAPNENHTFHLTRDFSPSVADLSGKWWLTGGDTDFR